MENKIRKLKADEIEVKVKQITENGCLLLLYKTARVDMQILDETFGMGNWQSDYKVVNDNLYCGIGVNTMFFNKDIISSDSYIWKWDCGIESKKDDEGNEAKGEASDAFKRAGFKWGIGRELYTTPFLWAKVPTKEIEFNGKRKFDLVNRFQKFYVEKIEYDDNNISYLLILDDKNNKIIEWGKEQQNLKSKVLDTFKNSTETINSDDVVKFLMENNLTNTNANEIIETINKGYLKDRDGNLIKDYKKIALYLNKKNNNKE